MNEIVERVARAIWDAEFDRFEVASQYKGDEWKSYIPHARAAIEAMREPTEAMKAAPHLGDLAQMETDTAYVWQAMIDAALETKP